MLPGISGIMAGSQSNNRFVEYLSTISDGASDTDYSFSSYNIGAADATRRVFIAFFWTYSSAAHRSVTSVSIAGQSATIHIQGGHTGGVTGFGVGIASAVVASGTSGTVIVSGSNTLSAMRIAGWRTINMERTTPFDTGSNFSIGTTDDLFTAVDVPEFGFTIGAHNNSTGALNTVTWTGLTEEFDSAGQSAAWLQNMSPETGRTVGISTSSEGDAGNHLVVLSWN